MKNYASLLKNNGLKRSTSLLTNKFSAYSTTTTVINKCEHAKPGFDTVTKPTNWDSAKPYDEIPGPKPFPIIGNSWRFVLQRDFVKMGKLLKQQFGDVVLMRKVLTFGDFLFLFNVKDIEWMLRNEGPYPMRDAFKSSLIYRHEIRKDVYGDSNGTLGLLNGQFDKWASFRTVVNPIMMQPRVTQQYIPVLNDIAEEFLVHIHKFKEANPSGEMPEDFTEEISRWAFESIVWIALDTRLGCLELPPSEKSQLAMQYIRNVMNLTFDLDFKPTGFLHKKFKTETWKSYIKYNDFFTDLVLELIDDVDKRMKNDPNYRDKPEHEKSVFEKLVAKDKKTAIIMTLDMLSAGIDTTSKASAAVLYFLAKNKDVQEKLRSELVGLLPSKDTPITKNILDEAKYLRATIKETLRVAPIAHSSVRRTTKNMVIGGYQIPSGILIMMPHIYLATGTDEHFKNPEEFKPDRWVRDGNQENVNAFVTLPFGFGPRSCIGKRMANMEMEIFIAKMVRNFYMDWPHKDMTFRQDLTYGVVDPLKLHLRDVSL